MTGMIALIFDVMILKLRIQDDVCDVNRDDDDAVCLSRRTRAGGVGWFTGAVYRPLSIDPVNISIAGINCYDPGILNIRKG